MSMRDSAWATSERPSNMAYEDNPPYDLSRSALRRKFGQRAIQSFGPEFNPRNAIDPAAPGPAWQPKGAFYNRTPTGASRAGISNGVPNPAAPSVPSFTDVRRPDAFYNYGERIAKPDSGQVQSGTSFVGRYGWGGVRSANKLTPYETAARDRAGGMGAPTNVAGGGEDQPSDYTDLARHRSMAKFDPVGMGFRPAPMSAGDYLSAAAAHVNDYMSSTKAPDEPFSIFKTKTKWEEPLL